MKHVPWYGPIYQEAARFEEKIEEYARAINIVEKGLQENPRYGPLWFTILRLYEKTSNGDLSKTREAAQRAIKSISKVSPPLDKFLTLNPQTKILFSQALQIC